MRWPVIIVALSLIASAAVAWPAGGWRAIARSPAGEGIEDAYADIWPRLRARATRAPMPMPPGFRVSPPAPQALSGEPLGSQVDGPVEPVPAAD